MSSKEQTVKESIAGQMRAVKQSYTAILGLFLDERDLFVDPKKTKFINYGIATQEVEITGETIIGGEKYLVSFKLQGKAELK